MKNLTMLFSLVLSSTSLFAQTTVRVGSINIGKELYTVKLEVKNEIKNKNLQASHSVSENSKPEMPNQSFITCDEELNASVNKQNVVISIVNSLGKKISKQNIKSNLNVTKSTSITSKENCQSVLPGLLTATASLSNDTSNNFKLNNQTQVAFRYYLTGQLQSKNSQYQFNLNEKSVNSMVIYVNENGIKNTYNISLSNPNQPADTTNPNCVYHPYDCGN